MTNLYHHLQQHHKPQDEECVKRRACNPELEAFTAFCTETNATTGLEYGTRVNLVVQERLIDANYLSRRIYVVDYVDYVDESSQP
ncbi:hypothetical protein F2P81_025091 [Scophthalmus maximus]|uniref:Uncharacterized protein n=1 Tax=Scophthalmus maximus TaxID=52904 RepID=A0A6A4RR11_SCOMX|nr:hypothetical protein F2P81_025091 [Scophthalmus maximus]